jgi:hypothetical protein
MLVRPAGSSIVVNEEQPRKVLFSMLVRPVGSSIDVIEEQPRKANSPMLVRPTGSAIRKRRDAHAIRWKLQHVDSP